MQFDFIFIENIIISYILSVLSILFFFLRIYYQCLQNSCYMFLNYYGFTAVLQLSLLHKHYVVYQEMGELSQPQFTSQAVKSLNYLINCTCFLGAKLFILARLQKHTRWELSPFALHTFDFLQEWSSYIGRCLQFFAQAGFPCPALRNPSDHFLRCINSDFDKVKATLKGSMKLRV